MALSRHEIKKDAMQQSAEAALTTTRVITSIVFDAIGKITAEVGSFATEIFEIREATKTATDDNLDE